jgi:hypothetical protein
MVSGTSNPIVGNAFFAGSLWAICPTAVCTVMTIDNSGGMQNNGYAGLQTANPPYTLIPTRLADNSLVNNLATVLQVNQGQVAITANNGCFGRQASGGGGCPGGAVANGPLSGIYTSGTWSGGSFASCPPVNGSNTSNTHCNVWTLAQGSFPIGAITQTPLLTDSIVISVIGGFRCFFTAPGDVCPNAADPLPGGANFPEFFYTNAWRVDDTRTAADCDVDRPGDPDGPTSGTSSTAACTTLLTAFQTGAMPWTPATTFIGPVSTPINSNACLRQSGVVRQPSSVGTAQGGSATTITLAATASAADQAYTGMAIRLTDFTGSGQIRQVTDYNGTTKVATVGVPWTTSPDGSTTYRLDVVVAGTQAALAGTNTITLDPAASATVQYYRGMMIRFIAGPGAGQIAEITDYDSVTKVATIGGNWAVSAPTVLGTAPALAAGSTATTVQLQPAEIFVPGAGQFIRLNGGTGAGQRSEILAYDAATKTVTVGTPLSPVPDDTTTYQFETSYAVQMVSCKLQTAAGQLAGWINRQPSASDAPDFQPARPTLNRRPINLYVKRPAGLADTVPTFKVSLNTADSVAPCPPGFTADRLTCYQGQLVILADNPAGTLGFEVAKNFLPATTINRDWCDAGPYLCGYAYPANHFISVLTAGHIQFDSAAGGPDRILGNFLAVNAARTASASVLNRSVFAGTLIAQHLDVTGAGQAVPFYQAPWNLNFLPQGSSPTATALAVVLAANWRQVQ